MTARLLRSGDAARVTSRVVKGVHGTGVAGLRCPLISLLGWAGWPL